MHSLWLLSTFLLTVWSQQTQTWHTLLGEESFSSQNEFEKSWAYLYPWGSDHNGAARMDKAHVHLANGVVTITAQKISGQPDAKHGGKNIKINYLSGAIHAKQHFKVSASGGLDFIGEFKAPVARGTWPAFWLTADSGWPPEVDLAEWKGSGKISFNTFNTSKIVSAKDVGYPSPGEWHKFKTELRAMNNKKDVEIKFYMDSKLVTTQHASGYVGKGMWL
ncbi:glycoside hydrolase family 16 protein [Microthyrium microscopicum]|uniref:Glycoside hydrolase family 16 protein n=1 Tax=Microthyrium microscopicum TaxID=703497 RepID=A0A6A6UD09_9PEZI|nr:glycoside hydrolase family 16 protein [Microthyrium microscopicum]